MPWISEAQSTSCFLNCRQTKARISRRSGIWVSAAEPRSENGISDSVPSRLSITTLRARTPRAPKMPEPDRIAGLYGIVSSARVSSMMVKASPSKMSMVAMGGCLPQGWWEWSVRSAHDVRARARCRR
jgi:hypothetical protein